MWDFQHTPSRRGIFISCVGLEISGWSISGPIAGGTECPRNLARIDFFLNYGSDTKAELAWTGGSAEG